MNRNFSRREFIKRNSLIVLGAALPSGIHPSGNIFLPREEKRTPVSVNIQNEIILHGRRNNQAWFEPAIGVIPGSSEKPPQVFIRATLLTGNDVGPQLFIKTDDLGKTWSNPTLCQNWFKVPLPDHVFEEPWFGFFYHRATDRFLAIGYTHFVRDEGRATNFKNERHYTSPNLKGSIVYSLWDPKKSDFTPWERMKTPENLSLGVYYNGQFHEQADGSILIPGYIWPKDGQTMKGVTVLKCMFTGSELQYVEHGSVHVVEEARGLAEPSIVEFGGKYFLTARHDMRGYVTKGDDGLHYKDLITWKFDDGTDLGNYNTQQKWLKFNERLYLIYNRKSELNNGVFRSRAPLFMAEVDPEKLCVLRNTEKIVFRENRARMGNFNVAYVNDEAWVVTGEWLEGMFPDVKEGDRFWVKSESINYIQYIGDLLLARITRG